MDLQTQVEKKLCEDEHLYFTRRFFKPRMGFKFMVNWHHEYVACPDLQKLESGQGKAVMLWSVDTVAKHNQCSAKVEAWIEIGKTLR